MVKSVTVGKMRFPLDRKYYTRKGAHLWLRADDDGLIRIGMDSFLTQNAGYLNYISIDDNDSVSRGKSFGSFESAKFVSRMHSPVSGKIEKVNHDILKNPRKINSDPYGNWIIALRPDRVQKELGSPDILSDAAQIKEYMEEEQRRAKDDE